MEAISSAVLFFGAFFWGEGGCNTPYEPNGFYVIDNTGSCFATGFAQTHLTFYRCK